MLFHKLNITLLFSQTRYKGNYCFDTFVSAIGELPNIKMDYIDLKFPREMFFIADSDFYFDGMLDLTKSWDKVGAEAVEHFDAIYIKTATHVRFLIKTH